MTKRRWQIVLAVVLVAGVIAVAGRFSRPDRTGCCALDGTAIEPRYVVRVDDEQGESHDFCCILCAELWLKGSPRMPRAVIVTDETTARPLDAREAHFVRSGVVTTATTGNRIHAFAARADAERHVETARGRMLNGTDRPLQTSASP